MKYMITGAAGFIGSSLALQLLQRGDEVHGVDNLNDYYDVGLKKARLARISDYDGFTDLRLDLEDRDGISGWRSPGLAWPVAMPGTVHAKMAAQLQAIIEGHETHTRTAEVTIDLEKAPTVDKELVTAMATPV